MPSKPPVPQISYDTIVIARSVLLDLVKEWKESAQSSSHEVMKAMCEKYAAEYQAAYDELNAFYIAGGCK